MIRTLTLVFVCALLAGAAVGFFAKEAISTHRPPPEAARRLDSRIDGRLEEYRARYHMDDAALREIRLAHEEYYRDLDDLMRELRVRHQREFRELSARFRERIDPLLPEWARERPASPPDGR
jgi:hypothetical protein